MSRATLYVRFPDGTVRYGLYNGTIDEPCAELYDDTEQAWDDYGLDMDSSGEGEPVDLATDYGGGSSWTGTATRDRVTSALGEFPDYERGLPRWAR